MEDHGIIDDLSGQNCDSSGDFNGFFGWLTMMQEMMGKQSSKSSGWWFQPSEKYESQSVGVMKFPIYGQIKHVPNHQPVMK